jgi:hypothetical protein
MNAYPLATIIEGDLTLRPGSSTADFGWGDLFVNSKVRVYGTENADGSVSQGAFIVDGGARVAKNLSVEGDLSVLYSPSYLTSTFINTDTAQLTVSGGNGISAVVGSGINILSTGGPVGIGALAGTLQLYGLSLTVSSGSTGVYGNTVRIAGGSTVVESNGDTSILAPVSLVLETTTSAGTLGISNYGGLGSGSVSVNTGSGGFALTTNTGGPVTITSQGAGSLLNVHSNGPDQELVLSATGNTAGAVRVLSPSVFVDSSSGIGISAGPSGIQVSSDSIVECTSGTFSASASGTLRITGLETHVSSGTGGTILDSDGIVQVQSQTGVHIGTTNSVPITIGTNTNTVTILGDFFVRGNTETVKLQTVTVDDNILLLNSAPYGTSDGGFGIKRYQPANNAGGGDVVTSSSVVTGTVQNGGNTATTVHLAATTDFPSLGGYWLRVTGGTGTGQVRKIKEWDNTSKIATLLSTADQLPDVLPVEGMDLVTVLDTTSSYALYTSQYVLGIWDESSDEFAFVESTVNPTLLQQPFDGYVNVHVGNLAASNVTVSSINGVPGDNVFALTLTDNATIPVDIPLAVNYGVYTLMISPTNNPARTCAIFSIARIGSTSVPGMFTRIVSARGLAGDQLRIQWPANSVPQLVYSPSPGIAGTTMYSVRVIRGWN